MATGGKRVELFYIIRNHLLNSKDCEALLSGMFLKFQKQLEKFRVFSISQLQSFLYNFSEIFCVDDISVSLTTRLELCPKHSNRAGSCTDHCGQMHTCLFYLLSGKCLHGKNCHFGHDPTSASHNVVLLEKYLLDRLTITELRTLFTVHSNRHGITQPKICKYYNISRGCNKGGLCHALHICRPYVLKKCKFGLGCKRNHDIDFQVKNVLELYGMKTSCQPKYILELLSQYDYEVNDNSDEECQDYESSEESEQFQGYHQPKFTVGPENPTDLYRPKSMTNRGIVSQMGQLSFPPSPSMFRQFSAPVTFQQSASRNDNRRMSTPCLNKRNSSPKQDICQYYLKGRCKFGSRCRNIHGSLNSGEQDRQNYPNIPHNFVSGGYIYSRSSQPDLSSPNFSQSPPCHVRSEGNTICTDTMASGRTDSNSGIQTGGAELHPAQNNDFRHFISYTQAMSHHPDDVYKMDSSPRGLALIINNELFDNIENRTGSEEDLKILADLFQDFLRFDVIVAQNLTAREMLAEVESFARNKILRKVDSCAVAILSHGSAKEVIYGKDGKIFNGLPVDGYTSLTEICDVLSTNRCPALRNKPKLLIIQACKGGREDIANHHSDLQKDMAYEKQPSYDTRDGVPEMADFYHLYATVETYVAYRGKFVPQLDTVIRQYSHTEHVKDLATMLHREMSNLKLPNGKLTISAESGSLRKKWYLNPPLQ